MKDLTLYHYWRSSCSWRVRWALSIKKLSYQAVPVNLLNQDQTKPEFLKKNPLGFVPALEVGDQVLGESLAILEYLEEVKPTPALLPADPVLRAKVRQLALIIVAGTQPLQNLTLQKYYCKDEAQRMKDGKHWIRRGLQAYETLLADSHGKVSVGDNVTIADLCLIPQCYNAERFEVDLTEFPKINSIYKYCRSLPECRDSEPVAPSA